VTPRAPRVLLLAVLLVSSLVGCSARSRNPDEPVEDPYPKTYGEIEMKRVDLRPVGERSRKAMAEAMGKAEPSGGISQVISLDKAEYLPDDPVHLTLLWVNNTERAIRVCRRLFLEANFRPLIFLDDKVQVLVNIAEIPSPPAQTLTEGDFLVVPPFGEQSLVVNLRDLPRFGLAAGARVQWAYNLERPGKYQIRVGMRSVPRQLVPEALLGDPTADQWEGSTLSNVVEFRVRKR
jgi:hypothetical protein